MNVAGLCGFFRPGPTEPKDLLRAAILAALVPIIAVGYIAVLRRPSRWRDGLAILSASVAGYLLGLGDEVPISGPFRLAHENIPGFVMMRESWIANPAAQQGRSGPHP